MIELLFQSATLGHTSSRRVLWSPLEVRGEDQTPNLGQTIHPKLDLRRPRRHTIRHTDHPIQALRPSSFFPSSGRSLLLSTRGIGGPSLSEAEANPLVPPPRHPGPLPRITTPRGSIIPRRSSEAAAVFCEKSGRRTSKRKEAALRAGSELGQRTSLTLPGTIMDLETLQNSLWMGCSTSDLKGKM